MRTELIKVALYAYPQMQALAEASETAAYNRAVLSYQDLRPIEEVAMGVTEECIFACALKGLSDDVESILSHFTPHERALISYKYFRRGEPPAVSARAYCRRQCSLLRRLSRKFLLFGWTDERFFELFGSYAPFMRLLHRIRLKGDRGLITARRPHACARAEQAQQ